MSTNVVASMEEKALVDDLPYFPEKFPGKVCCLCHLGEKSALGQGEILQLKGPAPVELRDKYPADRLKEDGSRMHYGLKQAPFSGGECHYELDKIGQLEVVHPTEFLDEGFVYVHRMCIMWSLRKSQLSDADTAYFAIHFGEFLEQKCNFCGRYGASVNCKMNCRQVHHWPCAAAAGCLLILESFTVFCTEHLSQVPVICSDNNVECLSCSSLGDLSKLIMCSTCGDHFHSTCIGLANLPGKKCQIFDPLNITITAPLLDTRSGWNCARCTKCQICRQQDSNDTKYVKCEQCQKIYHASCLRPVISAIPKYGWKCNRCRVCTDCGSRTPGGGSSSRWHSHYTICDSCYQQRNKGFSCPICQKAYRAASHKEMVKCSWCHKFVHSTCDEEADLTAYHKKKEQNPDYDYVCPNCKSNSSSSGQSQQAIDSIVLSAMDSSSEQLNLKEIELDPLEGKPLLDPSSDELPKLPTVKKKVWLSNVRGRSGKFVLHRMGVMSQINKKRSTRGKGRQLVLPNIPSDRCLSRTMDTDLTSDKKLLLCSARDKFIQAQDICVMCGSLGIESDSAMITCAQCGQCYHPYCAGVKPSRGILLKGWRCLDCTVCEGCGKKNDEARLLLCDECDISYHIYCVNPPLETVPTGNWKCSFCTLCQKCGRNPTEKNEFGDSNMVECLPCSSQSSCFVCKNSYANGEMIIQCEQCELWSHFFCDTINAQLTIDYYDNNVYKCLKCRCSTKSPLTVLDAKFCNDDTLAIGSQSSKALVQITASGSSFDAKSGIERSHLSLSGDLPDAAPEALHWIDGVCLSESGLGMIKSLSTEIKRKRKMRQPIGNGKDGLPDGGAEETLEKYKDGMIWDGTENAIPEGFTISTNDEGVHILRKKRQRNLQKLGIGGFSVRNRGLKKESEETTAADQLNSMMAMDKKKKIIRKKQKNKLIEAYPVYLQEAFFGKPLLEGGELIMAESDSSDEIDASMKVYFTRPEGKSPAYQESATVNKSPAKSLKKVKSEQKTDNKTVFIEQMPMANQQKNAIAPTSNVFDPLHTEISNTVFANRHPLDILASPNISELDPANPVNAVPSSEIIEKPMRESPVMLVDNYMVPNQLPQDQKFHNQLYLPGNISVNSAQQLHFRQQTDQLKAQNVNKQNLQTMMGQVVLESQKRPEDEPKVAEPVTENLNAGTQKTAEKMRKDEDLGRMATISAVLYANTEHPDLKDLFPNWNDRCKQILKRWRSLCNEKKAPFLQKAKDNRSALRQRREQNKIPMPPKPQKQEEIGRVWKQQPKLKEDQPNMFVTYNGNAYGVATYVGNQAQPTTNNPNPQSVMPNVNDNLVIKATSQRTQVHATAAATLKITPVDNRLSLNTVYGNEPIGDKKLRNLLQKNSTEPMLMGANSDLFLPNDVMRLGVMQNTPITQNNPMLSISGKSQPPEGRALEQDVKMTEPQEATSCAVELENVGFSDLLGLGEGDDDDLLKSLTSDIGDDFNILEYADPELDVNVLNSLDFDDNEKCST
ncbi:histone-lysine N-methyltransferase 2C isoform X2 [Drosophila ficusphila]|uniref:histone-lysine N-methyltransferase 2C isoform X2 n=1 Tax=Drosophila ficusphila TaxID=30025 RepID=UPI0007E644FA|nr:histone-lysine N-methyltransferase 2C isoform X2 [Drosophila ficusphila]